MFMAVLFITTPNWKQLKFLPLVNDKLWYTHIIEYYSTKTNKQTKNNLVLKNMDDFQMNIGK